MYIHLHTVKILGVRVTVSPDMKAFLFALQHSLYLNFVLRHLYLSRFCLVFKYKEQIYEKKIYI